MMQRFFERFKEQTQLFLEHIREQNLLMAAWAGVDSTLRKIMGLPYERFSKITPHIWLGGQPQVSRLSALERRGIGAVVNMRSEYSYPVETKWGDMRQLHLPTTDNTAPSLEHLREGVAFIQEAVSRDQGVYVHCWAGLGRGPTMVAAYFISEGMNPEEAWNRIRRVRPFVRPTQTQQEQLETFAKQHTTSTIVRKRAEET